jgi:hypothetical protein
MIDSIRGSLEITIGVDDSGGPTTLTGMVKKGNPRIGGTRDHR